MDIVRYWSRFLCLALLLLFITVPPGFGQGVTATLTGTVADASGGVVPNANVMLTNELSGDVRRTVTNSDGYYSFPAVLAGSYRLGVEAQGFQKYEQKGVAFNGSDRRNVDVAMQVGAITQTVEVETTGGTITPIDSGEKAQTLNADVQQNIAVVGASAAEFLKILPGVAQSGNGVVNRPGFDGHVIGINGNGDSGHQSALGYFSPNGTSTKATDIVSDGAHVSDPGCNCATPINPHPDLIQEMKVMTANFSAENPKGPVVITTISKSGGTEFHGGVHISARDSSMMSGDWIDNKSGLPKPPDRFLYPGVNLGGPVLIPGTRFNKNRDKLFFFTGYEYFYQTIDVGQLQASVPTAAMRGGDYSAASIATLGPAGLVPGNPQPVSNAQFPGGIIPKSQWDTGGSVLMNEYPGPNANPSTTGGYNYVARPTFNQNGWQWLTRADYSISDNTKLFVRYNLQEEVQKFLVQLWRSSTTLANNVVPYPSQINSPNKSESVALNLTHVFTPTLTNEFVFSFTYIDFNNTYADLAAVSPTKIGYPYQGVFHTPQLLFPNITSSNQQTAQIANTGGFETGNNNLYAIKHLGTIGDNVAKAWGTHTAKAGFYGEYVNNIQPASSASQGALTFDVSNPNTSGNAYADLLLGRANSFSQANFNPVYGEAYKLFEFYAQDTWKVTRRLSFDYGMRFEHFGQWYDRAGTGFAVWNPATYTSNTAAYLPGLTWNKLDSSVPMAGYQTPAMFFAPRFGMAWDLLGTGKTIMRGGIGGFRYHTPQTTNGLSAPTGAYTYSIPSPMTLSAIDAMNTPVHSTFGSTQVLTNRTDDNEPVTWSYNLTISQRVPGNSLLEVAYVGSQTNHLVESGFHNLNAVPYGTLFGVANANSVNINLYRPMSYYADLSIATFDAYANYNSLQMSFNHRSARYTWMLNYTFSKTMGLLSGDGLGGTAIDPLNTANNYSPLPFDRRQSFNAAYSLSLGNPIRTNQLGKGALNGWQISGVLQLQSGVNLQMNATSANFSATYPSGVTNRTIVGTTAITAMPLLTCNPNSNLAAHQYINGSCFAVPTAGNNGPIVEPEMNGPWFFNSDVSLFKTFAFKEKHHLQFRFEAFNFLNHPVYSFGSDSNLNLTFNSAGQLSNPLFGYATNKVGHRTIELALKYSF